ncbi:MAG: DUF4418 family protein [Fretibacterium sp.]|nr:DUF4418 family protein [Fretibacterium sp.]
MFAVKTQKFLLGLNAVLGAALALTPFVLFPVCADPKPDGTPMFCWYSGIFITAMGVVVLILSLLSLRGKLTAFFAVLSAAAALMSWLVPNRTVSIAGTGWACGLCADPTHACRAVTLPALGVLVTAVILVSIAVLLWNFVKGRR